MTDTIFMEKPHPASLPDAVTQQTKHRLFNWNKDDNNAFIKVITVLFLLWMPSSVKAQLEVYGKFTQQGYFEPIINYNGKKKISEKLSVTFFGLIRKNWSQALIGISYAPSNSISFSSSMGIEHGKRLPRYSASVFMKKGQNTLLVLGELGSGKDNYLYKINLFHQFTDQFTFGAAAWRYHGLGPNFRFMIPKIQSTIWAMPAYDLDIKKSRFIMGVSLNM